MMAVNQLFHAFAHEHVQEAIVLSRDHATSHHGSRSKADVFQMLLLTEIIELLLV
jgi:hypothetical protein